MPDSTPSWTNPAYLADQIRANPLPAVGIAALVGHLVRPTLLVSLIGLVVRLVNFLAAPALVVWVITRLVNRPATESASPTPAPAPSTTADVPEPVSTTPPSLPV